MAQQAERRPSGLVIPKGTTMLKTWRCKAGHVRRGRSPFQIQMTIAGETKPILTTAPLCSVCLRSWLEDKFRAREVV